MPCVNMRTTSGASSQQKSVVVSLRRHVKRRQRSWQLAMLLLRRVVRRRRLQGRLLRKAVRLSILPECSNLGLRQRIQVLHFNDYECEINSPSSNERTEIEQIAGVIHRSAYLDAR